MDTVAGRPSIDLPPAVESVSRLLFEQLGRLLTIETTLERSVLPKLALEVEDERLTQLVQEHLAETRGHAGRVKQAFLALGRMPAGRSAAGLEGLRTEYEATASTAVPSLRPFVACTSAMGTEHYEINEYEVAIRCAEALAGRAPEAGEVTRLLRANLEEELAALQKLGDEADRLASLAV